MNLTFLNPLFLFGLAAGVLPILIHRLTRRKAFTRKFSAVKLLLQSQRIMARPQRLKHLLLLALRILALLGLVLIMARPVLTQPGFLSLSQGGAKVVVLDNSASMGFTEDRGERYGLAKQAAKEAIVSFNGQVALIPTVPVHSGALQAPDIRWMEPGEAVRELNAIPLSYGHGNPASALELAYRKLKDFKMAKEIWVISDMARRDWEGLNLGRLGIVPGETTMTFLRIGSSRRDPNLTVKAVRVAEGETVVGVPARLEVTVGNFSDTPESTVAKLYLAGIHVAQKSLELKGGEEGRVTFELFLDKPGWVDGEVRLSGDRLTIDDTFHFSLKVREKVRVLVVDGSTKSALRENESYYLVKALRPGDGEDSPFSLKVITPEELAGIDLKPFEAVFLLNVARPQASRLTSLLEAGKTVFLFLGDQVVSEEYNSIPLLPWRVGEVKEMTAQKPVHIATIDSSRESLTLISRQQGGESLKGAGFTRYFKVDGSARSLLALENKDPLLMEAEIGRGKVFLFASSADMDWNDLPLKTVYLPLIQGLVKEATGLTRGSQPGSMRWGEPSEEKVQPVQVTGPPGGPGIYKYLLPSGEVRRGMNGALEESDLGKWSDGEVQKGFGEIPVRVTEYQAGTVKEIESGRREIWPFLLAFLVMVLGVEMVLANGFIRWMA